MPARKANVNTCLEVRKKLFFAMKRDGDIEGFRNMLAHQIDRKISQISGVSFSKIRKNIREVS